MVVIVVVTSIIQIEVAVGKVFCCVGVAPCCDELYRVVLRCSEFLQSSVVHLMGVVVHLDSSSALLRDVLA